MTGNKQKGSGSNFLAKNSEQATFSLDAYIEVYSENVAPYLPQAEAGLGIGTRWSFMPIDTAL